jgi:hypothetical protein
LIGVDLKPKNGMPDAYEKADHLHMSKRGQSPLMSILMHFLFFYA